MTTRSKTTKTATAALAAAAILGSGCMEMGLMSAEVQAREVCVTDVEVEVPGDAPDRVEETEVVSDPAAELPEELDAEAELVGAAVRASGGVDDFGFLERARVDVRAAELEPVTLVDVEGEEAEILAQSAEWYFEAASDREFTDYLLAPELEFDLLFEGEMPDRDWAVEIDLCADASARYALTL